MRTTALLIVCVALAALVSPALAAGSVTATLTGRMLTVTGDGVANSVTFTPGGKTDAVTVTPTSGTTLNGAAVAVTFENVRSIDVKMDAGDDRVDFTSLKLRGNVRVRMDDGNDSVYFTGTAIRGRVAVRCGNGLDLVRTDSSAVFYGSFRASGEKGNDELQIVNSQFRNRLRLDAGDDDDHVLLQTVTTTDTARVEVYCGPGLDFAELNVSTFGQDVFVDAGPDNDRVRFLTSRFSRSVSAFGGPGEDDVLSLEGSNVYLRFRTFDGFEEGQPL